MKAPEPIWQTEFLPIEPGPLRDSMRTAGAADARIVNYRMNRRTDQRGVSPVQHLTLAVMGAQTSPFIWCGQEVTCDSLHAFPPGSEFDAIGPRQFDTYLFMLHESCLDRLKDLSPVAYERLTTMESPNVLFDDHQCVSTLREEFQRSLTASDTPSAATLSQKPLDRILKCITAGIARSDTATAAPVRKPQLDALARAIRYARTNVAEAPLVTELSGISGMKERTLRNAFEKYLSMPPKVYIQILRLELVRRDLSSAGGCDTRIADIANRWGFWHMGQFASDYRRRFGELPSATMDRTLRRRGVVAGE